MKDFIYSTLDRKIYAEVILRKDKNIAYCYEGNILVYNFPEVLEKLIYEYNELVNEFSISLLDEVEEKIYDYGLKLKLLNVKIFNPCIKDRNTIVFFTKYPTAKGFVDDYPS